MRNQLLSMTGASFAYDGLGRRLQKTVSGATTDFLYDGVNPVQELSGGTPTANLLTGLSVDEFFTRGTETLLIDALGSTVALSDSNGTVQTEYTYEPFGATTATGTASTNSFNYTGREDDETGLYYYRSRYYHPSLQRFISEDPIEFAGGDVNLHAYVWDSPVNFTDPSGEAGITFRLPPYCKPTPPPTSGRKDSNPLGDLLRDFACDPANWVPAPGMIRAPGVGPAGRALDDVLRGGSRLFRKFLRRVEGEAVRHGGATRSATETRQILDEAIRRGYRFVRGVETKWAGGRHIHLRPPGGGKVDFPLPPDLTP